MQFDSNNPYSNNPYSDNLKFLKQIFARPVVMGITVCTGILLAVMVYNLIYSVFNMQNTASLLYSSGLYDNYGSSVQAFSNSASVLAIIIQAIPTAIYVLPFLGFLLMYVKSRNNDDSSSPKSGLTLNMIFSIIYIIAVSIMLIFGFILLFISLAAFSAAGSSSSYDRNILNISGGVFLVVAVIFIVYFLFSLLWIVNGLRLCLSAKRAVKGMPLSNTGAGAFGVFSVINVVFIALGLVVSIISIIVSSAISSSYITVLFTGNLPSFINMVANLVLNIFLAMFAFSYKKAVNAANYSIAYNGTNRYTGNVSNAAAYYQSSYQDINAQTVNPPANTQNYQQVQMPVQQPQNFSQPYTPTAVMPPISKSDSIKCPSCGAENDINVKFCMNCGTSLSAQQYNNTLNESKYTVPSSCPTCGAAVSSENSFCMNCGTKLK